MDFAKCLEILNHRQSENEDDKAKCPCCTSLTESVRKIKADYNDSSQSSEDLENLPVGKHFEQLPKEHVTTTVEMQVLMSQLSIISIADDEFTRETNLSLLEKVIATQELRVKVCRIYPFLSIVSWLKYGTLAMTPCRPTSITIMLLIDC